METNEPYFGVWQAFMLVLSIFAIAVLAFQTFWTSQDNFSETLQIIDYTICFLFFADFVWNLVRSRPMSAYLKWGWLDLISSIPMLPVFRLARLSRIVRILRILRAARASKHIFRSVFILRARSTFAAVALGSFILLLFAALSVVTIDPTMPVGDAFWWCLSTLVTGEYGDYNPSSMEGRIITFLLMTAGVALFGTFTASVASIFLEQEQKEDEKRDVVILQEILRLSEQISELRNEIGRKN